MIGTGFDSTKIPLQDLVAQAADGRLQLPDFQRGWVWDDERIKSLLSSVSVSFPVGAVMLLETGGEEIRFKPRPVAGTDSSLREIAPDTLILDGQQRLTSLYRALWSKVPVETKDTKGKKVRRWYYMDMKRAVSEDADREDAVVSVPEDKLVKAFGGSITLDVTGPEKEFESFLFPVNQIFQSAGWRRGYNKHWSHGRYEGRLFDDFEEKVIKRFESYQVPVIGLTKETPKEAVCVVFERVNTGGVALTVFELLTATFAADDFQLRDDWKAREKRLKTRHPVLQSVQSDDFLQAISLLATQERRRTAISKGTSKDKAPGISCKRRDILKLQVADWQTWADRVEDGFVRAARFLHGQKIFDSRDVPYRTQLVPLAAILTDLGKDGETDGARREMARWYWCGVLGELYGGAIETRFARDLPGVVGLVRGAAIEPVTILESNFQAGRLLTLRTRNSSAYKGLYALLMRDGASDFRTGETIEAHSFFDDKIDIHHIFPKKWCTTPPICIEPNVYNSVINKTAISARTNRQIGGRPPSQYLPRIERVADIKSERLDKILASHSIDARLTRRDDFWAFFRTRAELLLRSIEQATGKRINREPDLFGGAGQDDTYDDGPVDWTAEVVGEDFAP